VRRPSASPLRRLNGLLHRILGRPDPADPAFEDAARKAFLAGTLLDAPKAVPPAESMRTPVERPVGSVLGLPLPQVDYARMDSAPVDERTTDDPIPGRGAKKVDRSWPDLLRTPSGVTPVADDFFDGLIRRVERDR